MRKHLTVMMVALALTACAKKAAPTAGSPGASAPGSTPAAKFETRNIGLDLIGASERDPAVPGSDAFQGGISALDPAFADSEIILKKTLNLRSAGLAYFTFPEGDGEKRIDTAEFAVRTQGTDNRLGGDQRDQVVTYDRDAKRFFVELKDALSRRLEDIGPADEQILMIRLHYRQGLAFEFTLRFRVVGPLQALQVVKDEQLAPNVGGSSFLNAGAIVPLRAVTFRNPTMRHVAFWLKPVREDLVFTGRFHDLGGGSHGGERMEQLLNWSSRMLMKQLLVTQAGHTKQIPYRSSSGWTVIHLEPLESIVVEWDAASLGCENTHGNIVGVSAEAHWQMESWVTDESHPAKPEEFQTLPSTLALANGPIGSSASIRTGDWDGDVFGGNQCR